MGATTEVSPVEVRDLYLARHENAKYWQEYTDFAYYRLHVSNVYFIGGFGIMGWVRLRNTLEPGLIPFPIRRRK